MRTPLDTADLLACAVAAAQAGGGHALANAARRGEIVRADRHDVKLRLDFEAQQQVVAAIRRHFPDHAILGEEDPYEAALPTHEAGYLWIVDPIDGTVNFSHGLPLWCCSVAVRQGARVVAGAVYAPELDRLFTATADGPALCNGRPLRVSETADLARAVVCTGTNKSEEAGLPPLHFFERIAAAAQRPRINGSAALDLCWVAAGAADAYFESGVYLWDVSAAGLIVERAGGRAETLQALDAKQVRYLASNGRLHEALRRLLAEPPDGRAGGSRAPLAVQRP